MYRRQKFFLVWSFLFGLALIVWSRNFLIETGYDGLEAFFEDILVYVIRLGVLLVPASAVYAYLLRTGKLPHSLRPFRGPRGWGRKARCHQCRRQLQEYNGSNCNYCRWIRCTCGACGCSFGKMV